MSALLAYLARHVQALLGALGRLLRKPIGTLFTVLVIALALALPACLGLFVKNVRLATGGLAEAVQLTVYFKVETPLEQAQQVLGRVRNRGEVATVEFISADTGLEQFREYSGFGTALDALPDNPLPHVMTVRPRPESSAPRDVEALQRVIAAWPEVELVQLDSQWVRRLTALLALLRDLLAASSGLLALGVLAVIGNTIRLEIGARRAEIEVTQLVGGSDAFVRRPFLYTGWLIGLFGGLLAFGIVLGLLALLGPPVERLSALYGSRFALTGLSGLETALLVGSGALLGGLGAWLGAARQLARIQPRA